VCGLATEPQLLRYGAHSLVIKPTELNKNTGCFSDCNLQLAFVKKRQQYGCEGRICDTIGGETKIHTRKFYGKRTLAKYGHR
jgi:hypothetical protein